MKRSIMQDIIKQLLDEMIGAYEYEEIYDKYDKREDFLKRCSTELLSYIEHYGMLPPEYKKPDGKYFDRVNEWEAEE